eukprot:jgi/Chlat1/5216/Chrsp33S05187
MNPMSVRVRPESQLAAALLASGLVSVPEPHTRTIVISIQQEDRAALKAAAHRSPPRPMQRRASDSSVPPHTHSATSQPDSNAHDHPDAKVRLELERQVEQLQARIQAADAAAVAAAADKEKLQSTLLDARAELRRKNDAAAAATSSFRQLTDRARTAELDLSNWKDGCDQLQKKVDELMLERKAMEETLHALSRRHADASKRLRAELNSEQQQSQAQWENGLARLQDDKHAMEGRLRRELAERDDRTAFLEQQLNEARALISRQAEAHRRQLDEVLARAANQPGPSTSQQGVLSPDVQQALYHAAARAQQAEEAVQRMECNWALNLEQHAAQLAQLEEVVQNCTMTQNTTVATLDDTLKVFVKRMAEVLMLRRTYERAQDSEVNANVRKRGRQASAADEFAQLNEQLATENAQLLLELASKDANAGSTSCTEETGNSGESQSMPGCSSFAPFAHKKHTAAMRQAKEPELQGFAAALADATIKAQLAAQVAHLQASFSIVESQRALDAEECAALRAENDVLQAKIRQLSREVTVLQKNGHEQGSLREQVQHMQKTWHPQEEWLAQEQKMKDLSHTLKLTRDELARKSQGMQLLRQEREDQEARLRTSLMDHIKLESDYKKLVKDMRTKDAQLRALREQQQPPRVQFSPMPNSNPEGANALRLEAPINWDTLRQIAQDDSVSRPVSASGGPSTVEQQQPQEPQLQPQLDNRPAPRPGSATGIKTFAWASGGGESKGRHQKRPTERDAVLEAELAQAKSRVATLKRQLKAAKSESEQQAKELRAEQAQEAASDLECVLARLEAAERAASAAMSGMEAERMYASSSVKARKELESAYEQACCKLQAAQAKLAAAKRPSLAVVKAYSVSCNTDLNGPEGQCSENATR